MLIMFLCFLRGFPCSKHEEVFGQDKLSFFRVKFIQQLNSLILALSHKINDSIFKHELHIITI